MKRIRRRSIEQLFPRDLAGRIALAVSSLFFVPVSGFLFYGMIRKPFPANGLDKAFHLIVEELLGALFLFFAVGFIWAIATPRWLEPILRSAETKLSIGLLLISASLLIAMVLFL
jgi:hypothetical protein